MRTLNYVVLVLVLVSFGFVSFGCGDSDSPTAPSSASSTTMAEAPSFATSSTSVRTTPASFDADFLAPVPDGFNAYDFHATYDGSMLSLTLEVDAMSRMREASKPHRNRLITVDLCPVEPHHVTQSCGNQIWQGSMQLAGRLELPVIPLQSCAGWIVVNAAELSDDRYNGWRNAPCPTDDGDEVGSDGTGPGWEDSRFDPPARAGTEPDYYTLPFTITDPVGDITQFIGSGQMFDLISLSMSRPDSDGWISVTFTIAAPESVDTLGTTYREFYVGLSLLFYTESGGNLSYVALRYSVLGGSTMGWQKGVIDDMPIPITEFETSQTTGLTDTFSFRFKAPADLALRTRQFTVNMLYQIREPDSLDRIVELVDEIGGLPQRHQIRLP